MFRRVKNPFKSKKNQSVFIGTVGGPVPAPPPTRGPINLPTANMGANVNGGGNISYFSSNAYYGSNGYDYPDMGLDDYNALHYYGLDGLDNIDF